MRTYRIDKVCPHTQVTFLFVIYKCVVGKATRLLDLVENPVDTTVFSFICRESMGMKKWPVLLQVHGFHKVANIRRLQMFVKCALLLERSFNPD